MFDTHLAKQVSEKRTMQEILSDLPEEQRQIVENSIPLLLDPQHLREILVVSASGWKG